MLEAEAKDGKKRKNAKSISGIGGIGGIGGAHQNRHAKHIKGDVQSYESSNLLNAYRLEKIRQEVKYDLSSNAAYEKEMLEGSSRQPTSMFGEAAVGS